MAITAAPAAPPDTVDPFLLSPSQWGSRLAALQVHGATDTDPRVTEARAALAAWRVRRVLDAERGALLPAHTELLAVHLRDAAAVVA